MNLVVQTLGNIKNRERIALNKILVSTLKIEMIYCKISIRGKEYDKYKSRRIIKKTRKI